MDDLALVLRAKQNDQEAFEVLMSAYAPLVRSRANGLFLLGADSDDTLQEGMIGLFLAVRDFDPQRGVPWPAFAELCIRRHLIDALRRASSKRQKSLNDSLSLEAAGEDELPLIDQLAAPEGTNPEQAFLQQEFFDDLQKRVAPKLSKLEAEVFPLFLAGHSHRAIAGVLGREPKIIDNAIQRVRAKAMKIMREETV